MAKLDFKAINAAALNQLPSLLPEWLPGGEVKGKEYFARNPTRDDHHANSFSVNRFNGMWHDFATGDKGGDPISLYAYLFCAGDNGEAARQLSDRFGSAPLPDTRPAKPSSKWQPAPVPANPPKPIFKHYYRGDPESVYPYLNAEGRPLGYVCRFVTSDGGKETIPLTWAQEMATGREAWHWQAFAEPRPLYGLDRLAVMLKLNAPVLVVEGEKCADAATAELPDFACISWPGGSKAVSKADWRPLASRQVFLWPDCDALTDKAGVMFPEGKQPGVAAMVKVAETLVELGCEVLWVDIPKPGEKPSGWDVADAIDEGLHGEALAAYIAKNAQVFREKSAAKSRPPVGEKSAADKRKDLDEIIDKTDDFEDLTERIKDLVWAANLSKAARVQLLTKISKKTKVPTYVLSRSGGGDDDSAFKDPRLTDLNKRHAIVPMGGRVLILNRDYDPVLKKNFFSFSTRSDFELRYCNQTVFRNGEQKGIGEIWIYHPKRTQYEGIVFLPGGESNGFLNLWQGWGVQPKQGHCERFLSFIGETICTSDDGLFDYVLKWCAHIVQRPQELPETALVLRGKEGAGKNQFASLLGQIVGGEHYLLLTSMNQVSGRFSGHLSNALLVFCNEAVWGGDKSAQGVLKSMITDKLQPVEYKGKDISMVANFKRLLMASNEDWVVPRGANDRHYVIIDVDDGRVGDYAYWQALTEEVNNGGAAAFMQYLLDLDITDWHPRDIPQRFKEKGWDLKIRGGGSVCQWWFDVLSRGWAIEEDLWPVKVTTEDLQTNYIAWATKHKIAHIETNSVLGKQLTKWGIKNHKARMESNAQPKPHYFLPSLDDARLKFTNAFDLPIKVLIDMPDEDGPNIYD